MKITIRGLLTAVLAFSLYFSFAQTRQLSIGDHLPDLILNNVLNYSSPTLNFSDFKGKNIIIDFWNHKCVPCVKAFPLIDSLQRIHKADLQFILVNKESNDSTKRFFKVRKNIKMPNVPLVTQDNFISSIFPHEGYPYSVWIDRDGIIRNFSGGYNTTEAHVADFIAGKQLQLFDETSNPTKYGAMKDASLAPLKFEFYSGLAHCNRRFDIGSPQREMIDSGRLIRLAVNCTSILNLIKMAYSEWGKYNFQSRYALDIKVRDTCRLDYPKDRNSNDQWMDSNSYSYEQWLPASRMDERFTIMQEDLKKYFTLDVHVEKRKVKTVVLSISGEKKLNAIISSGSKTVNDLQKLKDGDSTLASYRLLNYPFHKLVYYLQSWLIDYPFFKEVDFPSNVDLIFDRNALVPFNFQMLQKKFLEAGLNLRFEEREIPVLVIRDK